MNALMQLRQFELPAGADISNALAPIQKGLDSYREGMDRQFQGERALASERMNQRKLDIAIDEHEYAKRKRIIDEIGNLAMAADAEQDPAKRSMIHQTNLARHPDASSLPPMYRDPVVGPRLLMAEAGKAKNKLDDDYKRSQTELNRAHTNFYNSRAAAITAPPAAAPQPAPVSDPLQDAGLDEDGNIVAPSRNALSRTQQQSFYGPGQGETWQLPREMPEPMRLGGPRDDIDASMRVDEGRGSRGIQVAEADGVNPEILRKLEKSRMIERQIGPPPRNKAGSQNIWTLDDGGNPIAVPMTAFAEEYERSSARPPDAPSPMEQARARMYGPTGMVSPNVPGVVTDAGRNRRVDVPATREMQGQRAMDAASPDQQEKLRAFRQDQELWAGVYKRQPRSGYYYGPDGRELPLTDKNYKGDKEAQAQALINMEKIKQASATLLKGGFGGSVIPGADYVGRSVAGLANIGETGQAFADMKQAALGIAYALSGKTVAVAEMHNFIDAYGPRPGDGDARIKAKTERMLQFYHALLSANRGGQDYDKAFARAMAVMGVKNPDGTLAGGPSGPLSSSDGDRAVKRAPDLSNVSTEDLLRQLNGGR